MSAEHSPDNSDNGQQQLFGLEANGSPDVEQAAHPPYDFSGVTSFPAARLAHAQNDEVVSRGVENQQMSPGVTRVGQEAVRQTALSAAKKAKRLKREAQPERMSSKRAGYVDVSREAVKRKPGLRRLAPAPEDDPSGQ